MKSKCAILNESHKLEVIELETPELRDYDVLVKITYSGLCGTQIGEILGNRGTKDRWLPHLLGHEASGVVVDVGSGVDALKKGDNVVCTWIKRDKWCSDGGKVYEEKYNAGEITTFQEYSVISENRLIKVPYYNDLLKMSLYGCMIPTGAGSVLNIAKPGCNDRIAIVGIGNIGSAALLATRHLGCKRVTAIDINPEKGDYAYKLGAHIFTNKLCDEYDYIIEATGDPSVMELCTQHLDKESRKNSKVVFTGNPNRLININVIDLNAGFVNGSWGGFKDSSHCDIDKFIYNTLEERFSLEGLIYNVYSLDNIQQAVNDFSRGIIGKVLIKP